MQRVVLVGAGMWVMVMRNIAARPSLGYRLIGFLDDIQQKHYRYRAFQSTWPPGQL